MYSCFLGFWLHFLVLKGAMCPVPRDIAEWEGRHPRGLIICLAIQQIWESEQVWTLSFHSVLKDLQQTVELSEPHILTCIPEWVQESALGFPTELMGPHWMPGSLRCLVDVVTQTCPLLPKSLSWKHSNSLSTVSSWLTRLCHAFDRET